MRIRTEKEEKEERLNYGTILYLKSHGSVILNISFLQFRMQWLFWAAKLNQHKAYSISK